MKKRIVSVLLAVCLLCICFTFAGCKKTTSEIISEALSKTRQLDCVSAELKMEMSMSAEGMSMDIPITADIQAKGLQGAAPVVATDLAISMFGMDVQMQLYQEGEWVYIVYGDMKYKMPAADATDDMDYTDNLGNMLQDIPEELLTDVQMVKEENGAMSATISFPEEQFAKIYDAFIGDMNTQIGVDIGEFAVRDAQVKITIADGYVSAYEMSFTMVMTVEGVETATDVKAGVTYKNVGEDVTVTPPEGYQDFQQISQ